MAHKMIKELGVELSDKIMVLDDLRRDALNIELNTELNHAEKIVALSKLDIDIRNAKGDIKASLGFINGFCDL